MSDRILDALLQVQTDDLLLILVLADRVEELGHSDLAGTLRRYHARLLAGEATFPPFECGSWQERAIMFARSLVQWQCSRHA